LRYLFEGFSLDTRRRELSRGGALLRLQPQVFDLLVYLIQNRERLVSKDDLISSVWDGRIISESTLTTRINAARTAIGDNGEQQQLIKTVPRKGFRFVGVVREVEWSREAETEQTPRRFALPDKPSIAVLSFSNLSGDPEQDYFADGMAEEIITALSRCASLFVIARNSSFTYKGKDVDVRRIGRDLGVQYVLEGSVRRVGDHLRVVGQLVDATSGMHVWADRFDGQASDVFALQDQITERVVGALEPKLQLAEIERVRRKATPNLDAYDLMLRAQSLEHECTQESLEAALRCLEQARAIDPSYALALALAAYCRAERYHLGWSIAPEAEVADGLRLAERAIELGKDDPNVLWMASFAVRILGGDLQRARELVNRSLQLNPNSAIALTNAAFAEVFLAKPERALELLQRAERLSPCDPKAWYTHAAAAWVHFSRGGFEEAAARARKAWAQNPRHTPSLRLLTASLVKLERVEEAATVVQQMLKLEPQLTLKSLRWRLRYIDDELLSQFTEALRIAGLPD